MTFFRCTIERETDKKNRRIHHMITVDPYKLEVSSFVDGWVLVDARYFHHLVRKGISNMIPKSRYLSFFNRE